ncbi:MAG: DUF1987 domain-containing protein [Magnetococcales bacterium]|nr:DUF1987 domain-containing protein [Magnetococcales bacterium]
MEAIHLEATKRTPGIAFDFDANRFAISGESYPEDVNKFFAPLVQNLEQHMERLEGATVSFRFDLIYFNSTTAKILMGLFETLDRCAAAGNQVNITWAYAADDSNMQELGEEFSEDLEHARFDMMKKE